MRRGTKHAAARALHTILTANGDCARAMHTVAARTDRTLLPTIVAALLDRNDQRRAREAAYQRFTTTRQQTAQRQRSRDQGYGREL